MIIFVLAMSEVTAVKVTGKNRSGSRRKELMCVNVST